MTSVQNKSSILSSKAVSGTVKGDLWPFVYGIGWIGGLWEMFSRVGRIDRRMQAIIENAAPDIMIRGFLIIPAKAAGISVKRAIGTIERSVKRRAQDSPMADPRIAAMIIDQRKPPSQVNRPAVTTIIPPRISTGGAKCSDASSIFSRACDISTCLESI